MFADRFLVTALKYTVPLSADDFKLLTEHTDVKQMSAQQGLLLKAKKADKPFYIKVVEAGPTITLMEGEIAPTPTCRCLCQACILTAFL
jgi:hypothetical protein